MIMKIARKEDWYIFLWMAIGVLIAYLSFR